MNHNAAKLKLFFEGDFLATPALIAYAVVHLLNTPAGGVLVLNTVIAKIVTAFAAAAIAVFPPIAKVALLNSATAAVRVNNSVTAAVAY